MGKVEDMRALREANYEARHSGKPRAKTAVPAVPAKGGPVKKVATGPLCGHRSVGGKSCIRPKDHDEKSHRYAKAEK